MQSHRESDSEGAEDAHIKLASVATDALGAAGRAMLKALIAGKQDAEELADMSRGLLRRKIPQLQQALQGHVTAHHRFLLKELLDHLEFVEAKMTRLEQEIAERLRPFEDMVRRLCTIPGIDRVSAWGIISEIGLNMKQFEDAKHLASWAGLCPGNWESAGKRKSGRIRKGSAWLPTPSLPIGLGSFHETEQLSLRSLPPTGSASRRQARDYCRGTCTAIYRLPHP
jgi:hypothetical protein